MQMFDTGSWALKRWKLFLHMSEQTYPGKQMEHESQRRDIVHFMSCKTDEFGHLVDGDMSDHPRRQSFTDSRTVSWATEMEHTKAAE